jgi:hypothetical protein
MDDFNFRNDEQFYHPDEGNSEEMNARPVKVNTFSGHAMPWLRKPDPVAPTPALGSITDQLFEDYDARIRIRDGALWSRHVFVLCRDNAPIERHIRAMSENLCSITICGLVESALRYVRGCDGSRTLFVMDIDMIKDIGQTVPLLLALRLINPELATLILSRKFHHTDLTRDRTLITDGSLKLPASEHQVAAALNATAANAEERVESEM